MSTGVIIQARMNSSRLYGKVLMDLAGKTVLQRVIERAWQIRGVEEVVVTTHRDWGIYKHVEELGYKILITNSPRYEESDVLSRYWETLNFYDGRFKFDTIVRITADCPLLDPEIASRVLENFNNGQYDYYSNCRPASTFPDGMDTEVFSYDAISKAYEHAVGSEREHVTPYIWNRPEEFRVGRLVHPNDLSKYRMTLDTQEDLDYIRQVYSDLGYYNFGIDDVLALPYHNVKEHKGYFDV